MYRCWMISTQCKMQCKEHERCGWKYSCNAFLFLAVTQKNLLMTLQHQNPTFTNSAWELCHHLSVYLRCQTSEKFDLKSEGIVLNAKTHCQYSNLLFWRYNAQSSIPHIYEISPNILSLVIAGKFIDFGANWKL